MLFSLVSKLFLVCVHINEFCVLMQINVIIISMIWYQDLLWTRGKHPLLNLLY